MAKNVFVTKVFGAEELEEAFDQLPKSVTNSVLRATAKKALVPVRESAKSYAPRDQGGLEDSIEISTTLTRGQRRYRKLKSGDVAVYVGPTRPWGNHGHLIEFGTGPRYHESGKYVGVMPAQPFVRPAWDTQKFNVLEKMREEIWGVLKKAAARLRKQAEKGKLSKTNTRFFGGG